MWRVYYEDGTIWNWEQGLDSIEPYGVICILQESATVNRNVLSIICDAPYYILTGEEWIKATVNDVEDYLAHKISIDCFLVGRSVSKKKYVQIYNIAKSDKDMENL